MLRSSLASLWRSADTDPSSSLRASRGLQHSREGNLRAGSRQAAASCDMARRRRFSPATPTDASASAAAAAG